MLGEIAPRIQGVKATDSQMLEGETALVKE